MQFPELIKWPGLLVQGDPVTPNQACEIVIRTHSTCISTNNEQEDAVISLLLGLKPDIYDPNQTHEERMAFWEFNEKRWKELQHVDLQYLKSCQLCSAWIGGPYGWVDFEGRVFAGSFNIGKWPDCETVLDEWSRIAKAFPFLRLRSQLLDREIGEDGPALPVIEYVVTDGKVEARTEGLVSLGGIQSEKDRTAMWERCFTRRKCEHCDPRYYPLIKQTVARLARKEFRCLR